MTRIRNNPSAKRRSFRDFNRKRYGNPLFNARRQRGGTGTKKTDRGSFWRRVGLVLASSLVIAAFGYAAYGPVFRLTAIEIDGAAPLTEQRIREIMHERLSRNSFLIFPQSTVFFFDTKGAAEDIEREFFLEELSVRKSLPARVVVTVEEIPKRAVLFGDNRFLAVSESGNVIRELTEKEVQRMNDLPDDIASVLVSALGAEMVEIDALGADTAAAPREGNDEPLLFDDEHDEDPFETEFRPGDIAFSATTVSLILQASARLPDITGARVRWFNIREKDETVDATMDGGWHVYLTTAIPFDVQGERLSLILREKVGADRDRLEYVDLRYNERIFFKLRELPKE